MKRNKRTCSCKGLADQYMTLVTIYAAIINQEFDNTDDLEIFAEFLIVLGEQLSLAASVRGNCEDQSSEIDFEVDVNDNVVGNSAQRTYIEKKHPKKRVRKKSNSKNSSPKK